MLFSCKTQEKAFSPFSISKEEKIMRADAYFTEGIKEKNLGNYEKAYAIFEECLKLEGDKAPVYYELGKLNAMRGKNDLALEFVKQAVALNEKNKWYLDFEIDLTSKMGLWNDTEKAYRKKIALYPKNTDYLIDFSDFFVGTKQYDKALDVYNSIEEILGVNEEINKNKYIIYHQQKKFKEAEEELNKLIVNFPAKSKYYVFLANLKKELNQPDQSVLILEKALETIPNEAEILVELAHHYFVKGEIDRSFALHDQVMADPTYDENQKMDVLRKMLRLAELDPSVKDQVGDLLLTAGETHPQHAGINTLIGNAFYDQRKYEQAKNAYLKVLEINSNSYTVWDLLIVCDFNLGLYQDMLDHSSEAIENFPTQPVLYFKNALAYVQLNQYEKAKDVLLDADELIVDQLALRAQIYNTLGDVYWKLNNHASSDKYFEKSLEIDPNNASALNNYAYYLSLRKDKLDQALQYAKKANEIFPGIYSYEDTYGWIYFQLKDYIEALAWLKRAETNGGSSESVVNEHIGDVYFHMNELEKAMEYWQKALSQEGHSKVLELKIKNKKWLEE